MNNKSPIHLFTTTINVRVENLNYGNHLSFNALASMIQESNVRWLKSIKSSATELNIENNIGWMIREINIKYLSEGFYDDTLEFTLSLAEYRKTSITLNYEIFNTTKTIDTALATCELAFYNAEKNKVSRMPECILNCIS